MTTMTEERAPDRTGQPAIRRPAAGIAIDPALLTAWRERRAMSRQDLSDAIAALGLTDDNGRRIRYSRDALAKTENGYRRPKPRTLRALCAALSTADDPCEPRDLQPGGQPVQLPPAARKRRQRLDYNAGMRDFARAGGYTFKNPASGRAYYPRELREAYARHVLALAARDSGTGDPDDDGAATLARRDLRIETRQGPQPPLSGSPADPVPLARPEQVPDPEAPVEDLYFTVRTLNALRRDDIGTVGQLAALSHAELEDIRNLGVKGRAEIITALAELARTPAPAEAAQLAS